MHGSVTSNNPNVRPLGDAYFNDTTHGWQQSAAFTSLDFDAVPRVLKITAGTRYYRTHSIGLGSVVGSFGCSRLLDDTPPDPCVNRGITNLDALHLQRTYSGFRSRASISWQPGDAAMLYAAWSQGYRPGGFNRGYQPISTSPFSSGPGQWRAQARENGGYRFPLAYAPDTLDNTELGWRLNWLGGHLQWNGTLYREEWAHAQLGAGSSIDAGSNLNGGTFRVHGIETSIRLLIADGLSVDAGVHWNHARLIKEGVSYWANGTPIDFSALRTQDGGRVSNFTGTLGSPLAGGPPFPRQPSRPLRNRLRGPANVCSARRHLPGAIAGEHHGYVD